MKNRKGFLSKIIVLCLLLTIVVSVAACTQTVEFHVINSSFADDVMAIACVDLLHNI